MAGAPQLLAVPPLEKPDLALAGRFKLCSVQEDGELCRLVRAPGLVDRELVYEMIGRRSQVAYAVSFRPARRRIRSGCRPDRGRWPCGRRWRRSRVGGSR